MNNVPMLNIKAFVGMGLLVAAAVIIAQDAPWLKGTTAEKLKTLAGIQPGLGSVMIEYSNRAGNVYYAVQAGNWGLAAYQLPDRPAMPAKMDVGMKFAKADLEKLVGDLIK